MRTKVIVKRLRKTVGMSQQAMADKIGVTRQYIAKLEGTEGDILLQNFIKLCNAVGYTDYNTLFAEEEIKK